MTKAEGKDVGSINLMEDEVNNLNNSRFSDMHIQWFADEPNLDGGEGTEGDPAGTEGETGEPAAPELSGLWAGATAEQREQNAEYLKDFQKLPEFLDAHMDLKKKAEGAVIKPGEDATEEEVAAYKLSLGIPGKAEGYDLGEMPEGMQKDENLDKWFRESALTSNLSSEQAKGLYGSFNKLVAERVEAVQVERADAKKAVEAEMRKDYGADYDKNIAMSKRIMNLGGKDLWDYLEETGLGSDSRMIKAFAEFGKLISEDSLDNISLGSGTPAKIAPENVLYPDG